MPPQTRRRKYIDDFLPLVDATPPYVPGNTTAAASDSQPSDHQNLNGIASAATAPPLPAQPISNVEVDFNGGKPKTIPLTMREFRSRLSETTGDWPRRVGRELFVRNGAKVDFLENDSASLFGWLADECGVIEWGRVPGCVSKEEVFRELRRTATEYAAVETLPHEPRIPEHYYACGDVAETDGSCLQELIDRFSPETEEDKWLILAMFATPFWGGRNGSRPAFVIVSDAGRGVGKSKITEMVSMLTGGYLDFGQDANVDDIKKEILTADSGKRVIRLDNIKSLKFSSSGVESMITAPMITGKKMWVGHAGRPNTFTWFITFNAASFSTDMAQRSVIVKLKRPKQSGRWETETIQFIERNRERLISDLISFLKLPPVPLHRYTRWAAWETDILSKLPDAEAIQALLAERSGGTNKDLDEVELVEDFFRDKLIELEMHPDTSRVFVPSSIAGKWFIEATGERTLKIQGACTKLHQSIAEHRSSCITNHRISTSKGFLWVGCECEAGTEIDFSLKDKVDQHKRGRRF